MPWEGGVIAVCAWCRKSLGEKEPLADTRTTHSICDPCDARMEEQERQQRAAAEQPASEPATPGQITAVRFGDAVLAEMLRIAEQDTARDGKTKLLDEVARELVIQGLECRRLHREKE